jgi:hypothetical protein
MKLAWISIGLLAAACSSTQLRDSWKDPAFAGPPLTRVMVVGVAKSDVNRRVFEDGFTKALNAAGVAATPSYGALPEPGALSNERIEAGVKQANADGVLVTRVLRVKRDVNVTPGFASPGFYGGGYRGYYRGAYMSAPDVNVYDVLTIESTLWNMRTDKPAWSGTSEVTDPRSVAAATEELAKVLIARMKADGVL